MQDILNNCIYNKFFDIEEDENGVLLNIGFKNEDEFNFAFDVMDVMAEKCGGSLAIIYTDKNGEEADFTFSELAEHVNRAANYFESLGISRGDKVMLVLKRHYEFWISILALHKIGAIAVPATSQLQTRDYTYRFKLGKIFAIVGTAEDDVPINVESAENVPQVKVIVKGEREGWHTFGKEYIKFSDVYDRRQDSICGDDPMMMFFTSGTTGYPKIVTHNCKYPLGHFVTAKYWHNIEPGGLHLTVADTGWGKAVWGKLYGQWLCGGTVFIYDFDRFSADEVLPMFKKYRITTFCAPPTVYRMLIKHDLQNYDLSSIKCATTAGEPLNPEVFSRFREITGLDIMEGFGQTETPLIIGTLRGMKPKPGCMGKPVPPFKIGLMNSDGNECKCGEAGEIVIYDGDKRPCGLFMGYYDRDDLTAEVRHDGAYHTGDLAIADEDGYFRYMGRTDDIIKSSGYRIGPFEVENIIMELPYVLECAVSAEPDEIRGQIVKASVILVKGTEPSEELACEIQTYVKEKTAPYKYPRKVVFLEELPKTISGKTIRHKL